MNLNKYRSLSFHLLISVLSDKIRHSWSFRFAYLSSRFAYFPNLTSGSVFSLKKDIIDGD